MKELSNKGELGTPCQLCALEHILNEILGPR